MADFEAVVIGVSAGGLDALKQLLPQLSPDFSLAIIIVQHRKKEQHEFLSGYLNEQLNKQSTLLVKEAEPGEPIMPAHIYLAPGGYHLLIERDKTFSLSLDAPVCFSIPSIDVLFDSAADAYRNKLIGVILTGANLDGSKGLKKIRHLGGLAIVQDPTTADSPLMPKSALKLAGADHVLSIVEIGELLGALAESGSESGSESGCV